MALKPYKFILHQYIYEGDEENPVSKNKYLYCEGDPINNIDPSGNDAMWILAPKAAQQMGHVSLLLEEKKGKWFYFYWGDKNSKPTDTVEVQLVQMYGSPMKSFKSFQNSHYGKGYTEALKIKGDFSYSVAYARALSGKYNMKKYKSNKDYSLLKRNCMQVSVEVLLQGKLDTKYRSRLSYAKKAIQPRTATSIMRGVCSRW